MKQGLAKTTQGLAIGLLCAAIVATLYHVGAFETLEMKALDLRFRLLPAPRESATDGIAIVTVDQNSLEYVNSEIHFRWPWPRAFHGKIIQFLADAGARAVVFDMFFTEPDVNRVDIPGEESDAELALATADAGIVYHSYMLTQYGLPPPDDEREALRRILQPFELQSCAPLFPTYESMALPAVELTDASRLLGFVNVLPEQDNVFRRVPCAAVHDGQVLPSMSLAVAWDLLGRPAVRCENRDITLGDRRVSLTSDGRLYLWWYKPPKGQERAFSYYPAGTVLRSQIQMESGVEPQIAPSEFAGKVVYIGSTAPGLFDVRATPLAHVSPGVEIQATALLNLLRGDTVRRVTRRTTLALVFLCALVVGASSRGIRHVLPGATVSGLAAVAVFGAGLAVLGRSHIILDIVPPLAAIVGTFFAVTYFNYVTERRHSRLVRGIFEHYLDRSVVKTLISDPDRVRLGGEKRQATVLFTDVAHFTQTSEQMQPDQVVRFMNVYLDAMTDIIIAEGGFVDKFIGDEIVAIFGAPNELPRHAACACRAVLRMQSRLAELQAEFQRLGCPDEVFSRTGLSTGEIVVGNMGSESRMNYTAMGDVMNLGSRIEGSNKVYGTRTLVSGETAAQAGDAFVFREVDTVRVVGKASSTTVYELVGEAGCLGEDETRTLALYDEGMVLYRDRKWEDAQARFQDAADRGDAVAVTMVERCRRYRETPPPEDWGGVHVLEGK